MEGGTPLVCSVSFAIFVVTLVIADVCLASTQANDRRTKYPLVYSSRGGNRRQPSEFVSNPLDVGEVDWIEFHRDDSAKSSVSSSSSLSSSSSSSSSDLHVDYGQVLLCPRAQLFCRQVGSESCPLDVIGGNETHVSIQQSKPGTYDCDLPDGQKLITYVLPTLSVYTGQYFEFSLDFVRLTLSDGVSKRYFAADDATNDIAVDVRHGIPYVTGLVDRERSVDGTYSVDFIAPNATKRTVKFRLRSEAAPGECCGQVTVLSKYRANLTETFEMKLTLTDCASRLVGTSLSALQGFHIVSLGKTSARVQMKIRQKYDCSMIEHNWQALPADCDTLLFVWTKDAQKTCRLSNATSLQTPGVLQKKATARPGTHHSQVPLLPPVVTTVSSSSSGSSTFAASSTSATGSATISDSTADRNGWSFTATTRTTDNWAAPGATRQIGDVPPSPPPLSSSLSPSSSSLSPLSSSPPSSTPSSLSPSPSSSSSLSPSPSSSSSPSLSSPSSSSPSHGSSTIGPSTTSATGRHTDSSSIVTDRDDISSASVGLLGHSTSSAASTISAESWPPTTTTTMSTTTTMGTTATMSTTATTTMSTTATTVTAVTRSRAYSGGPESASPDGRPHARPCDATTHNLAQTDSADERHHYANLFMASAAIVCTAIFIGVLMLVCVLDTRTTTGDRR